MEQWVRTFWKSLAALSLRRRRRGVGETTRPRCLLDAPCFTSLDRRWLWRLEQHLVICGTTQYHRDMARDLRQYLNETCEHHWNVWDGDEHIEAHRQCVWCNHVEWGPASPSAASKEENRD